MQAQEIVKEIDFVIGMSDSIGDNAARAFSAGFYRGLAFGKTIQQAFDLGLSELNLRKMSKADVIPILLTSTGVNPSTTRLVGDDAG